MKAKIIFTLLILALAACTPATIPAVSTADIQNTSVSIAQTSLALTQALLPTAKPSPTSTVSITASPTLGLQPFTPFTMPDAIQVERWMEYQTELAKALFSQDIYLAYDPEKYMTALCEWDILGRSGEEVYTWAVCGHALSRDLSRRPAVIYLKPDGSIREVKVPDEEVNRQNQTVIYDLQLFPKDSQEKLCLHYFQGIVPQCGSIVPGYIPSEIVSVDRPRLYALLMHLEYRKINPEEPPLIILSAMLIATPTPAPQTFVPIMTPDAFQIEYWRGYQEALAKRFIPSDYVPFALCEWDILGRANQEVYVYAVCSTGGYHSYGFAVIHLAANETVQGVDTPYYGDGWVSDIQRMFPTDVQGKIASYDENHYIKQEMLNHIQWRRTHPDEPPLIVLSIIPTATPSP